MTIGDRIDSAVNKAKGKANKVAGDVTDDRERQLRGHGQELKGDLQDVKTDIKESFKDRR